VKPVVAAILLLGVVPVCARAQVVINPAALVQLAGIAPRVAPPPPMPAPARHFVRRAMFRDVHKHVMVAVVKPEPPQVVPVIARPATLPPPKPFVLHPIMLNFAAGSSALPAGAKAALGPVCAHATGFVAVDATAPGDPSDPSIAMRLSLARALAVRDALAACGIPAAQILPRALGDVAGHDDNAAEVSVAK